MSDRTYKASKEQIEALRRGRGWSIADLAGKALCSTRTIDSLLAGKPGVISTFRKLAGALNVPIESIMDLKTGSGNDYTSTQMFTINITLAIPFDKFDETSPLVKFLELLKMLLGSDAFEIKDIKAGSTILQLFMDFDALKNLEELWQAVKTAREADVSVLISSNLEFLDDEILRSITEITLETLGSPGAAKPESREIVYSFRDDH